jgi:hypothetical protein
MRGMKVNSLAIFLGRAESFVWGVNYFLGIT